jgi:hypothetical protein
MLFVGRLYYLPVRERMNHNILTPKGIMFLSESPFNELTISSQVRGPLSCRNDGCPRAGTIQRHAEEPLGLGAEEKGRDKERVKEGSDFLEIIKEIHS